MPEEIDELTLTAYALGELDGAEHAAERVELEARLVIDALARRQVEEIRATAQWVSAELAAETTPGLTDLQLAAIERRLEHAGQPDGPALRLRPVRRNWAFWGSLAASVVIVCTVMASVLPKLYHLGYVNRGDPSSGVPTPATGPAPYIVETTEPPSVASRDLSKPAVGEEQYVPSDAAGFPNAAPPVERGENTFVRVADSPLSSVPTLSAYPDDANKLASIARSLDNHQLPPADSLRTDEIINALPYHYAEPTSDEPVSASMELAVCPWNASHRLLRVGLRTADGSPATKPSTSPVAPDGGVAGLKVQIEFNPAMAGAYRLIGYETGSSAGSFRDGSIEPHPAGLVAAGRSATVLYEVIPAGMPGPSAPLPIPPLKYQKLTPLAQTSRELATVSIRYRDAGTGSVRMREFAVSDDGREFAAASEDFRTAAAAAAFGLALRDSAYKGAAGYQLVIDMLTPAQGNEASADRARLLDLAKKAKAIAG
jgi:hypothetical protein